MAFMFPVIRIVLYAILWVFSVVLFGLTAARLNYTLNLPAGDPLNRGIDFYDPIVAQLLVTALLTILWAPLIIHLIHGHREHKFLSRVWHELLVLSFLWLMWLVGAAVSTSIWPNLPSLCPQFEACRVLAAMVAFAWLGWIVVFALMVTTLMYATANSSWSEPAHGHWVREDPNRASVAGNYFVRERA